MYRRLLLSLLDEGHTQTQSFSEERRLLSVVPCPGCCRKKKNPCDNLCNRNICTAFRDCDGHCSDALSEVFSALSRRRLSLPAHTIQGDCLRSHTDGLSEKALLALYVVFSQFANRANNSQPASEDWYFQRFHGFLRFVNFSLSSTISHLDLLVKPFWEQNCTFFPGASEAHLMKV